MHKRLSALIFVGIALTGCQALDRIQTINDLANGDADPEEVLVDEFADALEVDVAGLSPSPSYGADGAVDLSLVSRSSGDLSPGEIDVQVKNYDGSYSSCDHGEGVVVGAAPMNVLTLLIDGSGSMERTYTDGECDTCPHDPNRERVGAAHRFIDTLYETGPDSQLSIAEFGPEPTFGMAATALHADFNDDRRQLWTALDSIGGHEPFGTPLYDSLYEMIEATADEADMLGYDVGEGIQRHVIILSDGQDNLSERHDVNDAIVAALDHGIAVYVVGLGPASASDTRFNDANNAIRDLQTLAQATGGFYAGVDDPIALHSLFDTVAYALAGGYERHTFNCVPADDAYATNRTPPSRGTRVEGRVLKVSTGDVQSNWAFIAP